MFARRHYSDDLLITTETGLTLPRIPHHLLFFVHFHIICSFIAVFITITQAAAYDSTGSPAPVDANLTSMADNLTKITHDVLPANITRNPEAASTRRNKAVMERTVSDGSDVPRDSPTALVIASSIAAVSILVFFVIAYLWHTHQLDSRARKLAIRLAADSEHAMRCRNCEPQVSRDYTRPAARAASRGISESSQEQNQYMALTPEEERGPGSDGGRSSVGVSESEAGDEDVFEPVQLPPIAERSRGGIRGGRGSHRKWSRSRKTSSGANLDKRDSAVTDKEILTHFASRRHSTFFI